jgi:hypothetical protein
MKHIPLTQGKFAIVDDEDYEKVSQLKWYPFYPRKRGTCYAHTSRGQLMHRFILGLGAGDPQTDHRNGNGLDNRRENLRRCTNSENNRNKGKQCNNKSGFKGVSWDKKDRRWIARIKTDSVYKYLGGFKTPELASEAYKQAAVEFHGEFARI